MSKNKIQWYFKVNVHTIESEKVQKQVPIHSQTDFLLWWQVLESEGCKNTFATENSSGIIK